MGKGILVSVVVVDVQKRLSPTKHYCYVIHVTWSEGGATVVYRRYSEIFDFHVRCRLLLSSFRWRRRWRWRPSLTPHLFPAQTRLLDMFPEEAGERGSARIIPFLPGVSARLGGPWVG